MMRRTILAAVSGLLWAVVAMPATAQTCSTVQPPTTADNRCASTAFVQNAIMVETPVAGIKNPVLVATTGTNIILAGSQTIDGVVISSAACWPTCRVLVKDQSTGSQNAIYNTASGSWTRAADWTTSTITQGTQVYVNQGTLNAGAYFAITTENPSVGSAIAFGYAPYTFNVIRFPQQGLVRGNTSNNVFDIQQDNATAFAAIGFNDSSGNEQAAIGWGNVSSGAPVFNQMAYLELSGPAGFAHGSANGFVLAQTGQYSGGLFGQYPRIRIGSGAVTNIDLFTLLPNDDDAIRLRIAGADGSVSGAAGRISVGNSINSSPNDLVAPFGVYDTGGGSGSTVALMQRWGRSGVVKLDLVQDNTGSPKWWRFRDTDNAGAYPLSMAVDGSGEVAFGTVIGNITATGKITAAAGPGLFLGANVFSAYNSGDGFTGIYSSDSTNQIQLGNASTSYENFYYADTHSFVNHNNSAQQALLTNSSLTLAGSVGLNIASFAGTGSRPICVTSAGLFEVGSLSAGAVTCP